MELDLRQIMHEPGTSLPFAFELDMSDFEQNGMTPIPDPVHITGVVTNTAGAVALRASLSSCLSLICDRCLKPFSREKTAEFETFLSTEQEDEENDDIVLLDQSEQLELDLLFRDVFALNLDTKNLCSEDCKGLCPKCGKNLNLGPCQCKKEIDPRLAKLSQLLERADDNEELK